MTRLVSRLTAQHVLKLGVGTGLTLAQNAAEAHITGVDVSRDMVATARRRVRPADAEALDLVDASFDSVTLPYVLSDTPNPECRVAEVRRACRPGSYVIVYHFSGQRQWCSIEALMRRCPPGCGFEPCSASSSNGYASRGRYFPSRPSTCCRSRA